MYNKYFTMKRSELKEAIKAEFTSVLSEQSNNPDFDKKIANFAKKINNEMDYQGGVLEAMKQIKSRLERIISKVEGAKRGGADEEPLMKMIGLKEGKKGVVVDPDEIMMHINQYQSGNIDGDDLAQAIEEILVAMMNKSVTFSDIREGTWSLGKASDINIILSQLQDLSKKAYNIIGDDEFYNGIDAAITRAEELMMNAPLNEDEDEAPVGDKETEKTARGKDKITIDFRNVMKKYNELKEKDKKEAVEYLKSNQDIVKKYKKAKEVNV